MPYYEFFKIKPDIKKRENTTLIQQTTCTYLSLSLNYSLYLFHLQFRNFKIVYRRYAGLYFCICVDVSDNNLAYLEAIHNFVEVLNEYFHNVCELDLVFNFYKVRKTTFSLQFHYMTLAIKHALSSYSLNCINMLLLYDGAVIQWITSCQKNTMTTRELTLSSFARTQSVTDNIHVNNTFSSEIVFEGDKIPF